MAVPRLAICLCSPHFPPRVSGVGDHTYFLANALAEAGAEVEVLTSVGEGDDTLYPPHDGVAVRRQVKTWDVRTLPELVSTIRGLRSDVLVIQYAPHAYDRRGLTVAINLLPSLARAAGKRVVVNFHELYIPFEPSPKLILAALWQRAMALLTAASTGRLAVNSLRWKHRLRRMGIRKPIAVIPVGSNIPRTPVPPSELRQTREALLSGGEKLLVACFGSTGPHRDAGLLVKALGIARKQVNLRIVWLGKAPGRSTRSSSDAVTWTDVLPHPEISRILSACDMFVLPFRDGVSTRRGTLAAGLMHALPVVTTFGATVDPIFVHGENVYLTPSGSVEGLAKALVHVGSSVELRARLSQGADTLHRKYFAWEVIAEQVTHLVKS